MKKTLAVLAASGMLALAVTGGAAGTASAATTTPSVTTAQALTNRVENAADPKVAFNTLPPADKKLFNEAAQTLVNRVESAADPKAAFNTLPPADKKLFRDINTPYGAPDILGAKLPQSMTSLPFTGCWSHSDEVDYQNALGWTLARGWQETHICAFNGIVYNVWVDNQDSRGYWAWSAAGNTVTTYNAYFEGRGAVRFAFNVTGTFGQATLCLRIFVNGNGYNWRKDSTCPASA